MNHIPNASRQLGADGWHKPWSGHNGGSCVEIKPLPGGRGVAIIDHLPVAFNSALNTISNVFNDRQHSKPRFFMEPNLM